jgi:hypothetical protein
MRAGRAIRDAARDRACVYPLAEAVAGLRESAAS